MQLMDLIRLGSCCGATFARELTVCGSSGVREEAAELYAGYQGSEACSEHLCG
jgi:hypothetical protein